MFIETELYIEYEKEGLKFKGLAESVVAGHLSSSVPVGAPLKSPWDRCISLH